MTAAGILGGLILAVLVITALNAATGSSQPKPDTIPVTLVPGPTNPKVTVSALDRLAAYARGGDPNLLTYVKTRQEGLPSCPGRDAIFTAPAGLTGVRLAKAEAAAFVRAGLGHTRCSQDQLTVLHSLGQVGAAGTVTYDAPNRVEVDVNMTPVVTFN